MLLRSPRSGDPADTAPAETVDVAKAEAFPDGFDFGAIDLDEYIKLGDYDGITVALTTSSEITEKDVADYVANVLAQNTFTVNVDRPAQNGDVLIIDYAGSIDGELFEGGLAQDREITLGAGGFIPGFEDGIVGMRAGETKTVTATFPQDYGVDELNGKAAQFEITVSSVAEKRDPEYTDEFVKQVLDFDSIEAYEEYVRGVLADQRAQTIDSEKQSAVLTRISGGATVLKYPEGLAESYAAQQIASARSYADMYGVDYDTFVQQGIGMTAAAYEQSVLEDAREYVKETMVLFAVAKAENLMPTEEERVMELYTFLSYYGYEELGAMCEDYGLSEAYVHNLIDTSLTTNAALDFVVEHATYIGAE